MIEAPGLETVRKVLFGPDQDLYGDTDNVTLARQIDAATALANRQAPDAPEAVGQEAIIRAVGYLFDTNPAERDVSPAIWQKCGAKGLLAPWTIRRAGLVAPP